MPQYFQDIRGLNALGSGLRLLPMIGGLVAGMLVGTRLASPRQGSAPAVGAKLLVTGGFMVMAVSLAFGALTKAGTGTSVTAAWFTAVGLGLGLALPAAMNAAIGALSAERSGSGSALISALRQVGATIGVAVLGTVLSSAYRSRLEVSGLPGHLAGLVRQSLAGGITVAHSTGSAPLLATVRTAFVHALDLMLVVCGVIALTSAVLALTFLPRGQPAAPQATERASRATEIGT
jgi:hypothetical protein